VPGRIGLRESSFPTLDFPSANLPTILSHPAVPLSLALVAGGRIVSPRLLLAGVAASILPDLDVIGFKLGVAYGHELGHRGFSHSLVFALGVGALAAAAAPWLRCGRWAAFLFVAFACASHGLLDMLTNGGKGIALLWPLTDERLFLPQPVIQVSPLSLDRFFGPAGLRVLESELRWVWLPAAAVALLGLVVRKAWPRSRPGSPPAKGKRNARR
jgi:inner membrane protein